MPGAYMPNPTHGDEAVSTHHRQRCEHLIKGQLRFINGTSRPSANSSAIRCLTSRPAQCPGGGPVPPTPPRQHKDTSLGSPQNKARRRPLGGNALDRRYRKRHNRFLPKSKYSTARRGRVPRKVALEICRRELSQFVCSGLE